MKFGQTLETTLLQKWKHRYIAYEHLKRIIKEVALNYDSPSGESSPGDSEPSPSLSRSEKTRLRSLRREQDRKQKRSRYAKQTARPEVFCQVLMFELRKVNTFYSRKLDNLLSRLEEVKAKVDELGDKKESLDALIARTPMTPMMARSSPSDASTVKDFKLDMTPKATSPAKSPEAPRALRVDTDTQQDSPTSDNNELSSILPTCISVENALDWLQTEATQLAEFCRINQEGFRKIVKKFIKNMPPRAMEKMPSAALLRDKWGEYLAEQDFVSGIREGGKMSWVLEQLDHYTKSMKQVENPRSLVLTDLLSSMEMKEALSVAQLKSTALDTERLLQFAVRMNNEQAVKLLTPLVRDHNAIDDHDCSALHLAAGNGFANLCTLLIRSNANVNVRNRRNRTPLHFACLAGAVDCVKILLHYGASVHSEDQDLRAALHMCALGGGDTDSSSKADMINYVGSAESHEQTPKSSSWHQASAEIIDLLIKQGADISTTDSAGNTSLALACQEGQHTAAVVLLENKADPNQCNWKGWSPLHLAARSKYTPNCCALIESLVAHGGKIMFDLDGRSPLHLAATQGLNDALQCLLRSFKDATVSQTDENAFTLNAVPKEGVPASPWNEFQDTGDWSLFTQSLSRPPETHLPTDADSIPLIDHQDIEGWAPIHEAVSRGHVECVRTLINAGASVDLQDKFGWTPSISATYHGFKDIAALLPPADLDTYSLVPSHLRELITAPDEAERKVVVPSISRDFLSLQPGTFDTPRDSPLSVSSASISVNTAPVSPSGSRSWTSSPAGRVDFSLLQQPPQVLVGESVVEFQVQAATEEDQAVYIIGDCEELGNWDISKAKPMKSLKYMRSHQPLSPRSRADAANSKADRSKYDMWVASIKVPVYGTSRVDPSRISVSVSASISPNTSPRGSPTATYRKSRTHRHHNKAKKKAPAKTISYKYIVKRRHSSAEGAAVLHEWEALPSNRTVIVPANQKMLLSDGTFGNMKVAKSQQLQVPNAGIHVQTEEKTSWTNQGWLLDQMRLEVVLGHCTKAEKRPVVTLFGKSLIEIDHIVVRCGEVQLEGAAWVEAQRIEVKLPISRSAVHQPLEFDIPVKDPAKHMHLRFEVYGSLGSAIGQCYVLPDQLLKSTNGALVCPLVSRKSSLVLGELSFEYNLITPFKHPLMDTALSRVFSKSIKVIGHRGAGSDKNAHKGTFRRSHVTENTILSFVMAGSLGAQYVEFDVHLTSDIVPVVYHDFMFKLPGSSVKIPVNHITLDDFLSLRSGSRKPKTKRSKSVDLSSFADSTNNSETQLTDVFATLEEVLLLVPLAVGFNIEIKYPSYEECTKHRIQYLSVDRYVNEILSVVFTHAGDRDIIFSSFEPDVAKAVSLKQPRYPVFFLTEGGNSSFCDPRRSSIRDAIHFARSSNLLGIVCFAEPLVSTPQIIPYIKDSGLMLCTYGASNNDEKLVQLQKKLGVDTVIVDHVRHIAEYLESTEGKTDEA